MLKKDQIDLFESLKVFNSNVFKDIKDYHEEEAVKIVANSIEEITDQRILSCKDDRFLKVYDLLEKIICAATGLEQKELAAPQVITILRDINAIDAVISDTVEEIQSYKGNSSANILINKAQEKLLLTLDSSFAKGD